MFIILSHGDIEHIQWAMPGEGIKLEANQLYWITDRLELLSLSHNSKFQNQGGSKWKFVTLK